jgi:DNA repair protein RecO (recombination protein O)
MEWRDRGLVLGTRPHGERDCVLEAFTVERGRHLGLVKSGRSRRHAASLQTGNTLDLTWRARLDEHLGNFSVEPVTDRAAGLIGTRNGPAIAQTLSAHLRLLAERDAHGDLYRAATAILDHAEDRLGTLAGLIRFEIMVLTALGFGLDLSVCALTGTTEDLAYVSPRTGRAACRAAGEPYAARLLKLPAFLSGGAETPGDVLDGFRLTGHFFLRDVWEPRRMKPPESRESLMVWVIRQEG